MDYAIFQFDSSKYSPRTINVLSRKECEHLCNVDEENVTKFDLGNTPSKTLQELLNDDTLDCVNSFFRVFIGGVTIVHIN